MTDISNMPKRILKLHAVKSLLAVFAIGEQKLFLYGKKSAKITDRFVTLIQ